MIYVSDNKVDNIIQYHEKNLWERISIDKKEAGIEGEVTTVPGFRAAVNVSGELRIERKSGLYKAIDYLRKENILYERLDNFPREGWYYEIKGRMVYREFESGSIRNKMKSKIKKRLRKNEFLEDDLLVFEIILDTESIFFKTIVRCKAKNIRCFGGTKYKDNLTYCSTTGDPGILHKEIPVKALIRVDDIDREKKIIYGNPLYIKRRHG